jgi:hypothetical protein
MRLTQPFLSFAIYTHIAAWIDASEVEFEVPSQDDVWQNWLKTVNVGGPAERIFLPTNNDADVDEGKLVQNMEFISGLVELSQIIEQAQENGKRVRAYGSKWSVNDIAYTDEYLVESGGLNYCKVGIEVDQVVDGYKENRKRLVFVQSGVMIRDLNRELLENGLALPTTGGGDGQRIAGAISTGTHGSANNVGSMQDYVKGIHLVIPGGHVYLQRASDRVVTSSFTEWLGDEWLGNASLYEEDDDLFNAALVSFGSFGLIHAVLLEAEPLYHLKMQSREVGYRDVKDLLTSLDVASLGFEGIAELPFHFEVTINPYRLRSSNTGSFVRAFQKITIPEDEMEGAIEAGLAQESQAFDLFESLGFAFLNTKISLGPRFKRWLYSVTLQFPLVSFFETNSAEEFVTKVPSQFFTGKNQALPYSTAKVPGTGLEIGVPLDSLQDALDVIFDILNAHPIPSAVAIRYVKKSNATLAFTKYGELTATVEMPGAFHGEDGQLFSDTGKVHEMIFAALWARRDTIPHSYSWGQQFPVNNDWVEECYGSALDNWQAQRGLLLDLGGRDMFANDLIEALGIHK